MSKKLEFAADVYPIEEDSLARLGTLNKAASSEPFHHASSGRMNHRSHEPWTSSEESDLSRTSRIRGLDDS